MKVLLDTHFLVWIIFGSERLARFTKVVSYQPWGVSPISLLEIQYLAEKGALSIGPGFYDRLLSDDRFVIDEVPLVALVRKSLDLSWTRDPFDRLLAAHSVARRVPLCTVDRVIRRHHKLLVEH